MAVLYANNATTTLAASITGAATSFSVASGKGALFPTISGSDYFYVTLANTAGTIEIVKVTARVTDTFTVTRGQDGTAAVSWAAGDKVDLRITKAVLDDLKTDTKSSLTSGNVTTALGYTPYNSSNPSGYITGITSGMVTTALGYTPYNSTNPSGYISGITSGMVTAALGYTPYNSTNPNGYITGITSTNVTTALGYTPYNSTNPSGYITASSSITGYSYGTSVLDTDRTIANRLPTSTGQSVRFDFANANAVGTGGNYAGVMTFSPWTGTTSSTGDASYQLVFGSTATNGSGTPRLRLRNGIDSTWNAWYDVFTWASLAAQNGWTPVVSGGVTRTSQTMWAKTGGNNATWDGQVYSSEAYPTNVYCQASFGNTTGFVMFGLNTLDGTTDTDSGYAVIDFAWYGNNGTLQIYESGTAIASYGSYTSSTVLTITYDGSNIRYYKDGSLQRTVARATGNGLYFDSSFYNNGSSSQLYNIEFGRLSQHLIRQDNIGSFAPSLTGSGASGTWGISITGNAATATTAANYLPLAGGTLTGGLTGTSLTLSSTLQLGGTGTNSFTTGTGDGADYTTHNFRLSGWNGMGFYNPTSGGAYPNAVSGYLDFRNGILDMKGGFRVNGSVVLHAGNYNSYSPTLTGGSASGTWGISITGSAASITGTYGGTLTSTQVTTALGYTPYNSTNPSGYTSNTLTAGTGISVSASTGASTITNTGVTSVNGLTGAVTGIAALSAGGVVLENNQTISSNYTMTTNTNGIAAGPITVATGVTVTIPTGSTLVIA